MLARSTSPSGRDASHVAWSISLTSRLLIRGHSSALPARRLHLERRLRRIIAWWRLGVPAAMGLVTWRRLARDARMQRVRLAKHAGFIRLRAATAEVASARDAMSSASTAILARRQRQALETWLAHGRRDLRDDSQTCETAATDGSQQSLMPYPHGPRASRPLPSPPLPVRCLRSLGTLSSWRGLAFRAAIARWNSARADLLRVRRAFRSLSAWSWREWYAHAAAGALIERRRLLASGPLLRALALAASHARTQALRCALADAHCRRRGLVAGYNALCARACQAAHGRHLVKLVAEVAGLGSSPSFSRRLAAGGWRRALATQATHTWAGMPRWPPSRRGWRPSWLCDARRAPSGGAPTLAPRPRRLWPPPARRVVSALRVSWRRLSQHSISSCAQSASCGEISRLKRARSLRAGLAMGRAAADATREAADNLLRTSSELAERAADGWLGSALRRWRRRAQLRRGPRRALHLAALRPANMLVPRGGRDHHLTHNAHICAASGGGSGFLGGRAHSFLRDEAAYHAILRRARWRDLSQALGRWRSGAAKRRNGELQVAIGGSCHARRKVARALWDWRAIVHRRRSWRMQRELDRLTRAATMAVGPAMGGELGNEGGPQTNGEGGERRLAISAGPDAAAEDEHLQPPTGQPLPYDQVCTSVRRASALAERTHSRALLSLLLLAWRSAARAAREVRTAEAAAATREAWRGWRRHSCRLRRLRRLRLLGGRLHAKLAMDAWRTNAMAREERELAGCRRRAVLELRAWRRQAARAFSLGAADSHHHAAAMKHAMRRAIGRLRAGCASRLAHALAVHMARGVALRAALARARLGAELSAEEARIADDLATRAAALMDEKSARLRLHGLWRWRAFAAAHGRLRPASGSSLRLRCERRLLQMAVAAWRAAKASRGARDALRVRADRALAHTTLRRLRQLAHAASAAKAVQAVEKLAAARRGGREGLQALWANARRRAALAHCVASASAQWARYLARCALRCLLRATVSRLLRKRLRERPRTRGGWQRRRGGRLAG